MFFSSITERSLRTRLLYGVFYLLLALGGITMVVPFLIMLSGSVEPGVPRSSSQFFPLFLVDDQSMWQRYLETKYHGSGDYLRMAWNDPSADYTRAELPAASGSSGSWAQFLREQQPSSRLFALGWLRASTRMPSYYGREFAHWVLQSFGGSLEKVNATLGTEFPFATAIRPPVISLIGSKLTASPLLAAFDEFMQRQPVESRFAWDVGGYYRAVYLPRTLADGVATYNARYRTSYHALTEIPFPAEAPEVGREDWMLFVTKILRPDFVSLTETGEARRLQAAVSKEEFLRAFAQAGDVRVVSADRLYAAWLEARGLPVENIPQQEIDRLDFEAAKTTWRARFVLLNFQLVLDEIALHGRALQNTSILVLLTIAGALLVNPLAAYALSRFKLPATYHFLMFFLVTIAFPAEVLMIPVFLQLRELSLLNTFGALILPSLANGFSIFLLKGFFDSLPKELFEAAELDGASEWTMFWQIAMNLSRPILAVIALNAFIVAYGAFFYALVLAPDPSMWTLMVYIYQLRQMVDPPVVYASLILTAIPTLLVFIFCQNIILKGIVVPSEK